ncbi:MAG: pyruvate formate-lyase-activating protein [Firmicutes bacterium]|jgi:pyruvate formate lyase activating enzyme|nr:pyruvate formate-lyase-activating protein [Bacillota bacterium]MDH7494591.1 pyruvate formate-lyase-activating protein [Bacillota bacterium]
MTEREERGREDARAVTGYVHSVETMGTVDDGGIRFVLFMQGCAMRCVFCHNPDTWLRLGREVTVDDVMREILDYKPFFEASGGGVTVSGGEPLLQHRFVRALFEQCGAHGLHRALDTAGYCKHGCFESVLDCTDLLLFSVKVVDQEKHVRLTGVKNDVILANLRLAAERGTNIVVRYVLIPTVNDSERDLCDVAKLVASLGDRVEADILPYDRMGVSKWKQLGLDCALDGVPEPTERDLARACRVFREHSVRLRTDFAQE